MKLSLIRSIRVIGGPLFYDNAPFRFDDHFFRWEPWRPSSGKSTFCVTISCPRMERADQSLGLIEGYSPGLAKMMARMAVQESFESGNKDLLFYAGVRVGPQAIARMAQLLSPHK